MAVYSNIYGAQIPGELFLRLSKDDAALRAAAWESALGQALRLFGGARGAGLAAGDVSALVEGLIVQDLPRGAEIRSEGAWRRSLWRRRAPAALLRFAMPSWGRQQVRGITTVRKRRLVLRICAMTAIECSLADTDS